MKLLVNLAVMAAYTGLAYLIAVIMSEPGTNVRVILTIATAYGFSNIHFVLGLMIYTRRRKEAQAGLGAESKDELFSS